MAESKSRGHLLVAEPGSVSVASAARSFLLLSQRPGEISLEVSVHRGLRGGPITRNSSLHKNTCQFQRNSPGLPWMRSDVGGLKKLHKCLDSVKNEVDIQIKIIAETI